MTNDSCLKNFKVDFNNCPYCDSQLEYLTISKVRSYFCNHCHKIKIKYKNKKIISLTLRHCQDYDIKAHQGSIIFVGTHRCSIISYQGNIIKLFSCDSDIGSDDWVDKVNSYNYQVLSKLEKLNLYM